MKLCLSLLIVLFFLVDSNAQPKTEEITWRNLAPSSEEFSVDVPTIPMDITEFQLGRMGTVGRYKGRYRDTFIYIFSEPIVRSGSSSITFESIKVSRVLYYYTNKWIGVIRSGSFSVFSFEDSDGFFHNVAMTRADTRAYSFHTVSTEKNDPIVKAFYRTLKVGDWTVSGIETAGDRETSEERSSIKASDSASASDPQPAEVSQVETTPVEITSKPDARRSGFANWYGTEGTVSLNVTFLANGKIGDVVPIKRLPFELTKNAIIAAKKIRFRPARTDGKPATVIQTVDYYFAKDASN